MALYKFAKAMIENKPIDVYNNGKMKRDFTYVDDIIIGINSLIDIPPTENNSVTKPNESTAPYRILNIGSNNPVELMDFIEEIENSLNIKAQLNFMPLQPGDVKETFADVTDLVNLIGYKPETTICCI